MFLLMNLHGLSLSCWIIIKYSIKEIGDNDLETWMKDKWTIIHVIFSFKSGDQMLNQYSQVAHALMVINGQYYERLNV